MDYGKEALALRTGPFKETSKEKKKPLTLVRGFRIFA